MATLTTTINYSEPAGTIITSLGTPGPAGPGVPPGGDAGQILAKINGVSYNTEWVDPQDNSAVWGQITGYLPDQGDLQTALDAKLDSSTAASTYLPLAGGYITGDIQSNNGSGYRSYDGALNTSALTPAYLQFNKSGVPGGALTVEWDGITFASGKQTVPYPGTVILNGYATESWVTTQLGSYLTISSASATYYPLTNPAGYITVSALVGYATESWVTSQGYLTSADLAGYATESWVNSQGFLTSASLAGYATESWVNSQGFLTSASAATTYFPLSGGALNGNSNVTIADSPSAADSELAGWGLGIQLSADHTQGTTVEYNGLHTYAAGSFVNVNPTGITFPDSTVQVTAYTGGAGSVAWGSVTGYLPDQTDLQAALDAKYDASNPSGFIGASGGNITGGFSIQFDASGGDNYSIIGNSGIICQAGNAPYNDYVLYGLGGLTITDNSNFQTFTITNSGIKFKNNTVQTTAFTSSLLTPYALLSGATFTGKITGAAIGVGTPSVNLGGQCDPAPASATNGDLWISNAVAPKLTYRMGGVNYNLPVLNQFNTFTNQMVIDTTSATTAALRVTQRGAGNAIEVEDSTTPDATRFVVDQFGKVGIGVAPDTTAAIKIDGNGMSFNGLVFNPTATAAHTGGSDTLDLLVTINGTAYRIGLRPA